MTGDRSRAGGLPRTAVVGVGIGGLAAAAFLRRAGLPVTVYEQAAQLSEVGAGVVVAPNAARLLRALGVLGVFEETAVPLHTGWEFRRWRDGRVLSAEALQTECERRCGERTYTAHRADLLDAIRQAVPAQDIRLGRRCVHVDVNGPRGVLRFADGERVEADVVVGASRGPHRCNVGPHRFNEWRPGGSDQPASLARYSDAIHSSVVVTRACRGNTFSVSTRCTSSSRSAHASASTVSR